MATTYLNNLAANDAKNKAEAARKELDGLLGELKLKTLTTSIQLDDKTALPLVAAYTTRNVSTVDTDKLSKLVTPKLFMSMVSVTQGAITDKVGTAILNQVLNTRTSDPSLSVKVAK